MVILIKALQVILSLSLLIFLHELGHFMWAKLFGIRVEKFYLFFDAGGKSIAKWKWGETEFGIGWLPFGGYCTSLKPQKNGSSVPTRHGRGCW